MSCVQMSMQPPFNFTALYRQTAVPSIVSVPANYFSPRKNFHELNFPSRTYLGARLPKISLQLKSSAPKRQHCSTVCLFGGKKNSDQTNEPSPWNPLEKAMGSLKKEQSIEDILRKQMQKQEYIDDGSGGGNRSGGGGGGDSGDSEDEGLPGMLKEFFQVILATAGFIFLYMFIIDGEEMTVIARDTLRFVFTGKKSIRLRRIAEQWGDFFQRLREKKEEDPYWLEREILNTPTWWDGPSKYRWLARRQAASRGYY